MIDIHTHILPHMDDGSGSRAESLAMLEASAAQGITHIVATPHFYATENSPAEFLERRAEVAAYLRTMWRPGLPEMKLGAEVCWFEGISQSEELESLRIEGTELLLLEMPFAPWTERQVHELWDLRARAGMSVMLAHVERYLDWQDANTWAALADWGVLVQCNASFFLRRKTRRTALRMLREGWIYLLGSDCHSMDQRPPRLGEVLPLLGEKESQVLGENERTLLSAWEVSKV